MMCIIFCYGAVLAWHYSSFHLTMQGLAHVSSCQQYTLFPKRNATFLKLPFFWGGVQVGEHWAKCHSCNVLLPVTPWSVSLGGHDLGSLTLVHGHHKIPGNYSCVSFGEECMLAYSCGLKYQTYSSGLKQRFLFCFVQFCWKLQLF